MMISTTRLPVTGNQVLVHSSEVRQALLRALAYADIFDDAPTRTNLYRMLEVHGISRVQFEQALEEMQAEGAIILDEKHCMFASREELAAIWRRREAQSAQKWQAAMRYVALIRCLPFIRMVAITGTLAVESAEATDDIDLFLITAPGRVWLARALTILVVHLAALSHVTLCPNYLIATDTLELAEHNLYSAHELVQMQPLYGALWYHQLRTRNRWTLNYLPNADIGAFPLALPLDNLPHAACLVKWVGERLLCGRLGAALDRWEMRHKVRKLLHTRLPVAPEEASFSPEQCKGHFEGHATRILRQFDERVASVLVTEKE